MEASRILRQKPPTREVTTQELRAIRQRVSQERTNFEASLGVAYEVENTRELMGKVIPMNVAPESLSIDFTSSVFMVPEGDEGEEEKIVIPLEKLITSEDILVARDFEAPEDGIVRNTPAIRSIIRSLREEIWHVSGYDAETSVSRSYLWEIPEIIRESDLSEQSKFRLTEKIEKLEEFYKKKEANSTGEIEELYSTLMGLSGSPTSDKRDMENIKKLLKRIEKLAAISPLKDIQSCRERITILQAIPDKDRDAYQREELVELSEWYRHVYEREENEIRLRSDLKKSFLFYAGLGEKHESDIEVAVESLNTLRDSYEYSEKLLRMFLGAQIKSDIQFLKEKLSRMITERQEERIRIREDENREPSENAQKELGKWLASQNILRDFEKSISEIPSAYIHTEVIGEGAFGQVYKRQTREGDWIVQKLIKELDPESMERVIKEMKTLVTIGGESQAILQGSYLKVVGSKGVPGIENSADMWLLETELIDGDSLENLRFQYHMAMEELDGKLLRGESVTLDDFPHDAQQFSFRKVIINPYLKDAKKSFQDILASDARHIFSKADALEVMKAIRDTHEAVIIEITREICGGLEKAHQKGILHRDIKPDNLMLAKNGQVKIIDWGLVKAIRQTRDLEEAFEEEARLYQAPGLKVKMTKRLTPEGIVVGTPAFLAPELIGGSSQKSSVQSDIWALGVSLIEMVSGEPPFQFRSGLSGSEAVFDLARQIHDPQNSERERLFGQMKNQVLRKVIERALTVRPGERFSSMQEMSEALELCHSINSLQELDVYVRDRGYLMARKNPEMVITKGISELMNEKKELLRVLFQNGLQIYSIDTIMEDVQQLITLSAQIIILEQSAAKPGRIVDKFM
ncbi:MAG: protein kinase [bacterium]|nr:protein kinase [bacterium]